MQYFKNLILRVTLIAFLFSSSASFAAGEEKLIFDPNKNTLTHYRDGKEVKRYVAVGGKDWCSDVKRSCRTPAGEFRIISKHIRYFSGTYTIPCQSKTGKRNRCRAPMPYAMKITSRVAFHGGNVPTPPRPASHGCIRLPKKDAAELFGIIRVGTPVIVFPYHHSARPKPRK